MSQIETAIRANQKESEPLLTTEELAEALKVPVTWVYTQSRQRGPGSIPCFRLGRYNRFRLSEVLDWLESRAE